MRPRAFSTRDLAILDCLDAVDAFPVQAVRLKYERRTGRVLSIEAARDALERLRRGGLALRRQRERAGYVLYSLNCLGAGSAWPNRSPRFTPDRCIDTDRGGPLTARGRRFTP